jgi:flagellin-like protein
MKTVRRIKKEEGVSPVIATILMVAITVVLAAVLYVIVSGMMTNQSVGKNIALACTQIGSTTSYKCTFAKADTGVDFTKIVVQVQKSDGTIVSSWTAPVGITPAVKTISNTSALTPVFSGKVVDNGDGAFGVGDDIYLTPITGQSLVGLTVKASGGDANGAATIT